MVFFQVISRVKKQVTGINNIIKELNKIIFHYTKDLLKFNFNKKISSKETSL